MQHYDWQGQTLPNPIRLCILQLPTLSVVHSSFANNLKWLNNLHRMSNVTPRTLYDKHIWNLSTHDVGRLHDALMLSYFDLELLQWHHSLEKRLPSGLSIVS